MARRSKVEFESEAAEAMWHASPAGRRATQREFARALRGGTALKAEGAGLAATEAKVLAELVRQAKEKATKAISIRVPVADLERAQEIAAREGIGYQTVLKRAIRAGLKRVS
ncbi:MAG: hypothetical protein M1541_10645 [Acidobacteria bacterium]|nr:hypothetical protein [Acidobacteriota bacterium]